MNIGTHNSLTYLTPKKWQQKLIKFTAKCQAVNYEEQYRLGARVFDVRLWYDDSFKIEIRHGRIAYIGGFAVLYDMFDFLDNKKDCYVRLICEEDSFAKKDPLASIKERYFMDECHNFETQFPNIKCIDYIILKIKIYLLLLIDILVQHLYSRAIKSGQLYLMTYVLYYMLN